MKDLFIPYRYEFFCKNNSSVYWIQSNLSISIFEEHTFFIELERLSNYGVSL